MAQKQFKVAAIQATPVFLDRDATVAKACKLIAEAAKQGASLVVFPEAYIPGYPDWVWPLPAGELSQHHDLYSKLLDNSIDVPSTATKQIGAAAKKAKVYVVIGINERNAEAGGHSLYNTVLYFGSDGQIMGKHRKLMPTGGERLVHAQGDGSTLGVYDTPLGRIGALICWENYMPLARYAMYAWGVEIYIAPTWDQGEPWLSTIRHIAKEGRVYVISCGSVFSKKDIPDDLAFKKLVYSGKDGFINSGDSAIVGPDGKILAGPLNKKEGILLAEVDLQKLRGLNSGLDVAGHYARPDVFDFGVNTDPKPIMRVESSPHEKGV